MKKTGKALSLVLSLALVVSSLATTFASAASKSESATIKDKALYVCNGGSTTAELTSPDLVPKLPTSGTLFDNSDTGTLTLKDVVVTGGTSLASVKKNVVDGVVQNATLVLSNQNVQGTVTLATRYEGSVTRTNDTDATKIYAQGKVTVNILKNGTMVIAKGVATGNAATTDGFTTYPDALDTLAKTPGDTVNGMVETVHFNSGVDATPTWSLNTIEAVQGTHEANKVSVTTSGVAVTYAGIDTGKGFSLTSASSDNHKYSSYGSVSVHAQLYTNAITPDATYSGKGNATTAVTNTVKAAAGQKTISAFQGATYLAAGIVSSAPAKADIDSGAVRNVNGSNIDFTNVGANDVTVNGGSVGKITGVPAAQTLTVEDGTVSGIDVDSKVIINKGTVNGAVTSEKNFVKVNGGTTGDIAAPDASAGAITISATGETIKANVGNLNAKSVTISSASDAVVKVGNIKAADGGSITISGDKVTVGQIDDNYNASTLTFNGFTGTIAAPTNAYAQGVGAEKYLSVVADTKSNVTVTGNASIYQLSVNDVDSTVTFANSIRLGKGGVNGSGTLAVAPSALYSEGSVSGISLKLTKDFKVGDTVFNANTDQAYVGAFTPVGFTVVKSAASTTVDTFKVDTIVFANLQIVGSSIIELNTSETYTATPYPAGTNLPQGDTIKWSFDGNNDYLVATPDDKDSTKITVKAIKKDATFDSLNRGVLTASVYDAYGYQDYNFKPVTFNVAIGTKPAAFKCDTTVDKTIKIGEQYTYKVTSPNGTDPKFGFGTNGVATIIKSWTANSGTTVFYYYTVVGTKEGATGAFATADKTKFDVLTVKGAAYKSDTSKVTILTGHHYTFKITADKGASAPVFQVCTFSAKNTVLTKKTTNADGSISYEYTVTANGSPKGDHGAYVNGVNVAVVTVK